MVYNLQSEKVQYDLSIVLPAYNPGLNFAKVIDENLRNISAITACRVECILVNDGSVSFQLPVTLNGVRIISYSKNRGKGYALREGVKAASADLIIYTDIDFPYVHQSLLDIYSELKTNTVDVAIGVRGEDYYSHLPETRVAISKFLRWLIKKFLRIPTDDTQCGLKGMNRKGKEVFLNTTIDRYLFDLEFIFLSAREKLNIKTVEVKLRPEVQLSKMSWKILLQEFGNFLTIFIRSI